MSFSRGDVREDGYIYWQYLRSDDYNHWVTPYQFLVLKLKDSLRAAQRRSKESKIPFDLTVDDLLDIFPDDGKCQAFGFDLKFGKGLSYPAPDTPSVDRIIPSLGYIKGNVRIISYRANTLRNNATIEELELLLRDARTLKENP